MVDLSGGISLGWNEEMIDLNHENDRNFSIFLEGMIARYYGSI